MYGDAFLKGMHSVSQGRVSFEAVQAAGERLRALLASNGVALQSNSVLAGAFSSVELAVNYWRAGIAPTDAVSERLITDLAAVQALAVVVPTIEQCKGAPGLFERLRALGSGDPRLTSKGEQSKDRDTVFELLAWHICMQFADDVSFNEPDIRCRYRDLEFGVACKAHYGKTDRAVQAIRKGWAQILGSSVAHGLVMVHLTNHFPHEKMSVPGPSGLRLKAADEPSLSSLFDDRLKETSRPLEEGLVRSLRLHKKSTEGRFHGVLYAAHTLAPFQDTRYRVGGMVYQPMKRQPPDDVSAFVRNVNAFWQDLEASDTSAS